jgi:hypothetical protein
VSAPWYSSGGVEIWVGHVLDVLAADRLKQGVLDFGGLV